MSSLPHNALTIKLESTGEQLSMWRTLDANGKQELQMVGCLPSQQPGPPMHIHFAEDESTEVLAGTMSVALDGQEFQVGTSESAFFPKGSTHRWWNDADEDLQFRGVASPAVDLDVYLHGLFDVINSAGTGRPSLFYLAHLMRRHRKTQVALEVPAVMQRFGFPLVVLLGTLMGKYRGTDWPGCPSRCSGVTLIADST